MNLPVFNISKEKVVGKIPKFNPQKILKTFLKILVILSLLCIVVGYVYLWKIEGNGFDLEDTLPVDIPKTEIPNNVAEKIKITDTNKNNNVNVAMSSEKKLEIPSNPFISSKQLSALAEAERVKEAETRKTPPTASVTYTPPNITVPSIPRANVPSAKIISKTDLPAIPSVEKNGTLQGVITGKDGKNIAIMSDGAVLSEGETYLDGRIAYIGGDGVKLDNGKKIKFDE